MSQNHIFSRGAFWLGLLCIILGCVLLFSPTLEALFSAAFMAFLGILILIGGLVYFIGAFREKGWNIFLMLLIGLGLMVIGGACLAHPLISLKVVMYIVFVILLLNGFIDFILAYYLPGELKTVFILTGAVSIIIASFLWYYQPVSEIVFIGIMLGIDLIVTGISQLILASYEVKYSKELKKIEGQM